MKIITLLTILLIFLLTPQICALEISYNTTIELFEDRAHEVIEITLNNTEDHPIEDFSYELPADTRDILVYDRFGNLTLEILKGDTVIINSNFRSPVQSGEQEDLVIEFDTYELVSILEGDSIFSALFSPPAGSTKRFLLKVELPSGMGLLNPISSGARTDIVPLPDETLSDGTSTTFVWDVKGGQDFAVFIRYTKLGQTLPPVTVSTVPVTTRNGNSQLLIFLVLFLILSLTGYYVFKKMGGKVSKKTEFMKEDEKIIIDLVRENEGIVQKRLADKTGFSKAKVSKIISDLQKRNIVEIEKIGRRNKVFLTENFKKG
jgi:uncharacterized membrane protein